MSEQIILRLKKDAKPHLYIDQVKVLMEHDKYLHPLMKNALLLLKKTRMPYLILATLKEIILIPEKNCHLERALQPQLTGYSKIDWTEEEIKLIKENSKFYFENNVFKNYEKLGYEILERKDLPLEKSEELIKLCGGKK